MLGYCVRQMFTLLLDIFTVIATAASSAVCPQFGSYQNSSCTYTNRDGLYLSKDSPAQCHGKVTQWNFCYRRSSQFSATHGVKFMVYRLNASTSVYYRVSNSLTTYISNNLAWENCLSIPLGQNQSFNIQPNDIAAACMIQNSNTNPLRLSCWGRNEALQITESSYDDCTEDQLLSLDIPNLSSRTANFLLLEAVISKFCYSEFSFVTVIRIIDKRHNCSINDCNNWLSLELKFKEFALT